MFSYYHKKNQWFKYIIAFPHTLLVRFSPFRFFSFFKKEKSGSTVKTLPMKKSLALYTSCNFFWVKYYLSFFTSRYLILIIVMILTSESSLSIVLLIIFLTAFIFLRCFQTINKQNCILFWKWEIRNSARIQVKGLGGYGPLDIIKFILIFETP